MHTRILPGLSTIPSVPSASEAALGAAGERFVYLTPDALMTYCRSRLDDLDTQIRSAFDQQQLHNETSQALTAVGETLGKYPAGIDHDADECREVEQAVQSAIDGLRARDPGNPAIAKLEKLRDDMIATGTGDDSTLSEAEVQGFLSTLKGIQNDVSAGSELTMIQLQSLMSQRQTAIQLCTNLVQSLGEQTSKIAANIGH